MLSALLKPLHNMLLIVKKFQLEYKKGSVQVYAIANKKISKLHYFQDFFIRMCMYSTVSTYIYMQSNKYGFIVTAKSC